MDLEYFIIGMKVYKIALCYTIQKIPNNLVGFISYLSLKVCYNMIIHLYKGEMKIDHF